MLHYQVLLLLGGKQVFLNLDVAARGVGTGACGPDTDPAYRLSAGTYQLDYLLKVQGNPDES